MTEGAQKVLAFCQRAVDYEKAYQLLFKQEQDAMQDAEMCGEDMSKEAVRKILLGEEHESPLLASALAIKREKLLYCKLMGIPKYEVYELVHETALLPVQRRIMILRFNRVWKWTTIYKRVKLSKSRAEFLKRDALERMVPTFERLHPDWTPAKEEERIQQARVSAEETWKELVDRMLNE